MTFGYFLSSILQDKTLALTAQLMQMIISCCISRPASMIIDDIISLIKFKINE